MDLYWTVNTLARNVTKWTVADDKRLHKLICYVKHTKDWVLKAHVGDFPGDIKLMEFVDASFAGDLTDSKSTSASILCLIGPRTFVPVTWMCKKQGAVSHSSSEAEVIALEMAVRMEVLTGLQLWDSVIDVYDGKRVKEYMNVNPLRHQGGKFNPATNKSKGGRSQYIANEEIASAMIATEQITAEQICEAVDYYPKSALYATGKAKCWIMEDNEACIATCLKGRSPKMAHINRTHRVSVDWLFLLTRTDPGICLRYVNTKSQLADIMTKGSFTAQTWQDLCQLTQVGTSITVSKGAGRTPDSITVSCKDGKKAKAKAKAKAKSKQDFAKLTKGEAKLCVID